MNKLTAIANGTMLMNENLTEKAEALEIVLASNAEGILVTTEVLENKTFYTFTKGKMQTSIGETDLKYLTIDHLLEAFNRTNNKKEDNQNTTDEPRD